MVKLCKLVHIVPDFLLGGVENMCAVSVHLDSLHILCVNVASDMITLVDYQTGLSLFGGLMGKYSSKQSGSYDQIVIFFHLVLPLSD